jgi:hypothetical protein
MKSEALALARVVEILGKTVVAIEPDKGSFDHPSAGEDVEARRMVGTLEDFDGPLTKFGKGVAKRLTGEGPLGEHMGNQGKWSWIGFDYQHRPSRSCTSAAWTSAPTSSPVVSVTI